MLQIKLSLNLSKTKYIIFGNRQINDKVKIMIHDVEIVYENRFLGVIINHKVYWKPHIINVKTKKSKTIAILYKTKDILNQKSLYVLYCSRADYYEPTNALFINLHALS